MRIGAGLPNQVRDMRPAVIPAWAREAENAGFTSLSTVGRYAYPGVSDTVALAAAAAVTSGIELISGVLLGPTWPGRLLAKELAGIDGVSNGRLTVGLGVGSRPDDFVVEGHGAAGRGKRFDQDLAHFRDVWNGEPVASAVCDTPQKVREAIASFEGIGADDLIFNTGTDDVDDIKRLAGIVL
jgi:alkanesulfonate monooxygenase SsuD/methylene tetrahydromethanopterin reductase-like flavin-dependent oxidoreductase (luciferase family)